MPDGCQGDRVQKTGRLGVHLKAGSGTAPFRTVKIGISEQKCGNSKKDQKSQIAPPPEPRALFCRNTHLNLCTGHLAAENPLLQCVALIKIGFFEAHIVQGLFECTNLKIFVCVCKMPSLCILQNFLF